MDKLQKFEFCKRLEGLYSDSSYVFIINVSGVDSSSDVAFRKAIRASGATAVVAKNRINKIAARNAGFEGITPCLTGQNITVFASDPVSVAKAVCDFSQKKDSPFRIVACADSKALYGAEHVVALSKLPSMDQIRGQILATIMAAPQKIAYSLSYIHGALVRVIDAKNKAAL